KDSVTPKATDANPGTLLLEKDGTKVEGYTNGKEILEEGTYKLTATDKVGNTTIVNFTIKYVKGDLNENDQIDIGDVLLLLRHIAQSNSEKTQQKHPDWKLNEKRTFVGDINKNGTIDIGDVLKLRRYMAAKASKSVSDKHPDWLNIE
ncbi:MAG: dockerin type I repeat-containing protein, partial [Clostridia bacterium]|nr:dockerin type I repeat-containing protein [Clostridia bacterium]